MQAVILAGGIGKRIAPLGINKPKAMFRVAGKPIIEHVLETIRNSNVDIKELVIVISPGENAIEEYLGDGSKLGFKIYYATQEKPLGQADALMSARKYIKDDFLVLNANDVYESKLLAELVELGQKHSLDVALVGREVEEPAKFGIMILNADKRLMGVVEKPAKNEEPSNIAVVGLYYFSTKIWEALDHTPIGAKDDQYERAYQTLINTSKGDPFVSYNGPYATYKYPWDLFAINDLLLAGLTEFPVSKTAQISPSASIDKNVVIEDNVRVLEYAIIRGPAYIGEGTIIGNHTLIRGGVSIGKDCVIGHATEITRSILGDQCWTHKNFIGDSIVSDNCSFGAGTITANLRFDEKPIKVRVGEDRLSSGKKYFGTIMAENCRTGCNVVLLPGVKIGPNSAIGPGVVLDDDLETGKIALLPSRPYDIKDNQVNIEKLSRHEQMKMLKGS